MFEMHNSYKWSHLAFYIPNYNMQVCIFVLFKASECFATFSLAFAKLPVCLSANAFLEFQKYHFVVDDLSLYGCRHKHYRLSF